MRSNQFSVDQHSLDLLTDVLHTNNIIFINMNIDETDRNFNIIIIIPV